jgi:hypothetical protein
MSGRYSLNYFGNIIKYDFVRSNIGIGVQPDIFARFKASSIGTGENENLWVAGLFGGVNDTLDKVAIGTINSNSVIASIDTSYNWKNLYLNSDTINDGGDVYIIGNQINSNNLYINSNVYINNGSLGIGKNYNNNIRLDVDGYGNGKYNINDNWITASFGVKDKNLNRIIIGVLNSNAIVGSYNSNTKLWSPLILNGDGEGNGGDVIVDNELVVNSNVMIYDGNLYVNVGTNTYNNAIFIGSINDASTIFSYNNDTLDYNTLYLNCDNSNNGNDVIIHKNLHVSSNITVSKELIVRGLVSINNLEYINSNIALYVNSLNNKEQWITASYGSCNIYDNRAIIGVLNSNVIIGAMDSNMLKWQPLYINGDYKTGKGNDVYVVNSLNIYSNLNVYSGKIGIGTSYSSNNLHIYSNIVGEIGITVQNANLNGISSLTFVNNISSNFKISYGSSLGGITSNIAIIKNNGGSIYIKTENDKGINIDNTGTVLFDSNVYIWSNLIIGNNFSPNGINSNTLSIFGDIALYNKLSQKYHYNIYTDILESNITWILPDRYPNTRELFTYNNSTGKLDWINIADFDIDYWNVGHSNYTGYITISENVREQLNPNKIKVGFKSSNISIGSYISRKYPANTYDNNNIKIEMTDLFNHTFTTNETNVANYYRIYAKNDGTTHGFNFIRSGLIMKEYSLGTSNIVNRNLTEIQNYYNNNTHISYDIINNINTFNYKTNNRKTLELSFLFIPTSSINYAFTIVSRYYYGSINIDTIDSSTGEYISITNYPLLFDYNSDITGLPKILTIDKTFGTSTSFIAGNVYRIIIRVFNYLNEDTISVYYTSTGGNLTQNNIFTNTTSIYYKLTNSKYRVNYIDKDYTNGDQEYIIDSILINDMADNYYYTNKYLTNTSNLINYNNITKWESDKIFDANGDILTTTVYTGIRDTNIGSFNLGVYTGEFSIVNFTKTGVLYSLADYIYNPISQGSSSYGTTIIYKMATDIKLISYGIFITNDVSSAPSKWKIYGSTTGKSNDGVNNYWDLIDDRTLYKYKDYKANTVSYFRPTNVNIINYYKYYAIVVSSIVGNSKKLAINSLIFNGIDNTYDLNDKQQLTNDNYLNDSISINYFGDVGIGTNKQMYKLDINGNLNALNIHSEGSIYTDNDVVINNSLYTSNIVLYGDLEVKDDIIARTITGKLTGEATLYNPTIIGYTNAYGVFNIDSNVGIGTKAHDRIRLDVDSVGTGLNDIEWVASRFGANNSGSENNVVIGVINGYASIGAYTNDNKWSDLLLNGDLKGGGSNVIVSKNLIINSNLSVGNDTYLISNLFVGSNVGIGKYPTNIRLDVAGYGTGIDANNWIASVFGGTQSTRKIALGAINDRGAIGAVNSANGYKWEDLILNGDNKGQGANVIISNDLYIGSNIYTTCNLFIGSNIGIGKLPTNYRFDINSYGTGDDEKSWIAMNIGGTTNKNRLVLGTLNTLPTIGSIDIDGKWSDLLLNGNGKGQGSNVIISKNLIVNSNIIVGDSVDIYSNIFIGSNIGIGKKPTNFRLDVNSYGTGDDNKSWIAANMGGTTNKNRLIMGTLNTYPTIGAYDFVNNGWVDLLLNGDYNGNGSNVIVEKDLTVKGALNIIQNLNLTGNFTLGNITDTGNLLTVYGNITTVGNDANNGKITATGGLIVSASGANITGNTSLNGTLTIINGGSSSITAETSMSIITPSTIINSSGGTVGITAGTTTITGQLVLTGGANSTLTQTGTITVNSSILNLNPTTSYTLTTPLAAITAGTTTITGQLVLTGGANSTLTQTGTITVNSSILNLNPTTSYTLTTPLATITTGAGGSTVINTTATGTVGITAGTTTITGQLVLTGGANSTLTQTGTITVNSSILNLNPTTSYTLTTPSATITTGAGGSTVINTTATGTVGITAGTTTITGQLVLTGGANSTLTQTGTITVNSSILNLNPTTSYTLTTPSATITTGAGGSTVINTTATGTVGITAGTTTITGQLVLTGGANSTLTQTGTITVNSAIINLNPTTSYTLTTPLATITTGAGGSAVINTTATGTVGITAGTTTITGQLALTGGANSTLTQTGSITLTAPTITLDTTTALVLDGPININNGGASTINATSLIIVAPTTRITANTLLELNSTTAVTINGPHNIIGNTTLTGVLTINSGGASAINATTLTITSATTHTGTLNISSLTTIASGGLTITSGGARITAGGLLVSAGGATITGPLAVDTGATSFITCTGFTVTAPTSIDYSTRTLTITHDNNAAAKTTIAQGTFEVTSTNVNHSAYFANNVYVGTIGTQTSSIGNVRIGTAGNNGKTLNIYGNINIFGNDVNNGNLSVGNGFILTTGSLTLSSGNITLTNGNITASGTGIGSFSGSLTAGGKLTVNNSAGADISGPLVITGGGTSSITATQYTVTSPTTTITANTQLNLNSTSDINIIGGTIDLTGTTNTITASVRNDIKGGLYVTGATDISTSLNVQTSTTVGTTLTVGGNTTINGGLTVTGGILSITNNNGATMTGNLALTNGNLTVAGTTTIEGVTQINDNLIVTGSLQLSLGTTFNNLVTITSGGLNITGSSGATITGATTITGVTSITGNTSITGSLTTIGASGDAIFSGTLRSGGALTVSGGGATITGNTSITGTTTSSGALTVSGGGAAITGNTSISGTTTSSGALTVSGGGAAITGNTSISGTLTTTGGGATIGGSITGSGLLTISGGGASITGNTNITGTTTSGGALTVSSGGATITGPINISSAGASSISGSTLSITGTTTIIGNTSITGTLTSSGKLTVQSGGMDISGPIVITGTITSSQATTLQSTLGVTGNTTIGGTLVVTGNTTLSGTLGITGATTATTITASGLITANGGITLPGNIQAGTISSGTGTNVVSLINGAMSADKEMTSESGTSYAGGKMGVGKTTGVVYELDVQGTIAASGDIGITSDERLKTDIETITEGLEKIKKARGVYFKRINTKESERDRRYIGVIAQEIEKIIPEVVITEYETEEKYKMVSYQNIVGVLIEAIKDLDKKIENIDSKINNIIDKNNLRQ